MTTEADEDNDFENLFCSICQVKLSSIRAYMAHCSGLSHVQKKAMKDCPATPIAKPPEPARPAQPATPQPATPQQRPTVPIIGPVRPMRIPTAAPQNKTSEHDEFYCEYCDVQLSDTRSYLTHCGTLLHSQKRAVVENHQMESKFKAIESMPRRPSKYGPMYESLKPFISQVRRPRRFTVEDFEFNMVNCSYCPLCEIACSGIECFRTHCAGSKHCKKFLVRQNELGFEQFRKLFGNLLYDKEDEEEPPPDIDDDYIMHCYRSGVHNNLKCRACGRTMFSYQAWYDHILSEDHASQIIEMLEVHGGPAFMNMFGDLPGPNPHLVKAGLITKRPASARKRRKEKEAAKVNVDAVQQVTDSTPVTPHVIETYTVPAAVPSGNVNAAKKANLNSNIAITNSNSNSNNISQNKLFRTFVLGTGSANTTQNANQSTKAAAANAGLRYGKNDTTFAFAEWKEPTSVSDPSLMPAVSTAATSFAQTAADNYSGYGVYTSVNSAAMWSMPYQTNAYNSAAMAAAYSNMYAGMATDPSVYWTAAAAQAQTQLNQSGTTTTTATTTTTPSTVSQATQPSFVPCYPDYSMYNYAQAMQGVWPQVGTSVSGASSTSMPAYWTSAYTNFQQQQPQ